MTNNAKAGLTPRIKLALGSGRSGVRMWRCFGGGISKLGRTPELAYHMWRIAKRHSRKKFFEGNHDASSR